KKDELITKLDPASKRIFEEFLELNNEAQEIAVSKHFKQGFRLGLVITSQAFIGAEDLSPLIDYLY
ncbi:MAG: hypothetical protein IJO48_02695, partial [Clostridia bacterium]|nr:hypothetical protein [Clostridia bacterium]